MRPATPADLQEWFDEAVATGVPVVIPATDSQLWIVNLGGQPVTIDGRGCLFERNDGYVVIYPPAGPGEEAVGDAE